MNREDAIQFLTDTGISPEHIMELVEALSNSEKPNKWIPVSERLPEFTIESPIVGKQFTEDVLVYDGAEFRVGYLVRATIIDFDYWVAYGEDDYEPIAWMPIESYKASPIGEESEVQDD